MIDKTMLNKKIREAADARYNVLNDSASAVANTTKIIIIAVLFCNTNINNANKRYKAYYKSNNTNYFYHIRTLLLFLLPLHIHLKNSLY